MSKMTGDFEINLTVKQALEQCRQDLLHAGLEYFAMDLLEWQTSHSLKTAMKSWNAINVQKGLLTSLHVAVTDVLKCRMF